MDPDMIHCMILSIHVENKIILSHAIWLRTSVTARYGGKKRLFWYNCDSLQRIETLLRKAHQNCRRGRPGPLSGTELIQRRRRRRLRRKDVLDLLHVALSAVHRHAQVRDRVDVPGGDYAAAGLGLDSAKLRGRRGQNGSDHRHQRWPLSSLMFDLPPDNLNGLPSRVTAGPPKIIITGFESYWLLGFLSFHFEPCT